MGGRGAGKSWVGSYDLIRRAKRGRLYLVGAPTYPMLQDATLRTFLAIAREMGVIKPGDYRKSPPLSVSLSFGAEVIFRSADDPERWRGPNLSGALLDEASLMEVEAFEIAIACLREEGEQGWLSAAFTPKGRQHWTFDVFGRGRPNTALFHARTGDNPFLPKSFEETVRQQYTSTLAAQELGGEFVDAEGSLFRREWFTLTENPPKCHSYVRYWDKAGTAGGGAYTAGVLMGRTEQKVYYVLDVKRGQWSSHQRNEIMLQTARLDREKYGPVSVWTEQEPGSGGKESAEYTVKQLSGYNVHAERATGDKATRAQPFAAQAEAGNVSVLASRWADDYLDELASFPEGKYKDQVDASSGAFNKLAKAGPTTFRTDRGGAFGSVPEGVFQT